MGPGQKEHRYSRQDRRNNRVQEKRIHDKWGSRILDRRRIDIQGKRINNWIQDRRSPRRIQDRGSPRRIQDNRSRRVQDRRTAGYRTEGRALLLEIILREY